MTVTGGLATGFLVNNVTGPVSVSNSGYIVDVSSTTGDPVSGVVVTSGSSETVRFADAVVGGTDYKGDLIVTGSGFATGVALSGARSEEHTSELQSLMRISYAVFCLKKKNTNAD